MIRALERALFFFVLNVKTQKGKIESIHKDAEAQRGKGEGGIRNLKRDFTIFFFSVFNYTFTSPATAIPAGIYIVNYEAVKNGSFVNFQ